jgi:hypothetical protein
LRGKKKLNSSLTPTKEIYPDNNPREKKDLGESVGSGKNTMSMISKQEALLQKKKKNQCRAHSRTVGVMGNQNGSTPRQNDRGVGKLRNQTIMHKK